MTWTTLLYFRSLRTGNGLPKEDQTFSIALNLDQILVTDS